MTGLPMEMAKKAATDASAKLGKLDCYGLVVFDSQANVAVPFAVVKDRAAIAKSIAAVHAGGGTEIFSALTDAVATIENARSATRRNIVLLTDGQAPHNGIRDLAQYAAQEGIPISTVGLGMSIDEAALHMIADTSGGRFAKVGDPTMLPQVFGVLIDHLLQK